MPMKLKNLGDYGSGYLSPILNGHNINAIVSLILPKIKKAKLNFDYIACRGMSGIVIAVPLAMRLNKGIIIVRKDVKGSHGSKIEASPAIKNNIVRYIIVDDFIDTGKTIKTIKKEVEDVDWIGYGKDDAVKFDLVGVVLYEQTSGLLNEYIYNSSDAGTKKEWLKRVYPGTTIITGFNLDKEMYGF